MKRQTARSAKPQIRLRKYNSRDFETLWQIDQLCYDPRIAYSRRHMRAFLDARGADCVVAESGPQVAGFCITARRGEEGYIITIDVLEAYRKEGLGSALITEAEKRLAEHGVREIALDTAVDNFPAISFWEKHGYRKIGIRKGYYPGGLDAFAMTKAVVL